MSIIANNHQLKEVVALVPVKGSSERVKKKNVRKFADTTLLELKLDQLSRTNCFKSIVVSSEDRSILEIAKSQGFDVHDRDPKYSTSYVPMSDVYSYVASEIEGKHIAWVNVTNPLVGPDIYENAVVAYSEMSDEHDCMPSAYELKEYVIYNGKPVNFAPNPWPKSQDLKGMYALSFAINMLRRTDMIKWGSTLGDNPEFFLIDPVISSDIDYQADFDFCEMLYKQHHNIK